MRLKIRMLAMLSLLTLGLLVGPAQAEERSVVVLSVEGVLTRSMVLYLERGFGEAIEQNAELIVIELNTPGGQIDLMQEMVELIRGSEVPVVVFVTPRGAVAGSAGTVITLAGHAAAMSPETAIGAASPVDGSGGDLSETLATKVEEVLKADVRALAERRGPAAIELAERTIDEATAATVGEAGAKTQRVDYFVPELGDGAEMLEGSTDEIIEKLIEKLKAKGGL